MKKLLPRVLIVMATLALLATACGSSGDGSIDVVDARYRLAREDLGAGYLSVSNTTGEDVTLTAASAPGVGRIELHETMSDDSGMMSMQERPDGFVVPAGETLSLEPGGKHLMIFDPTGRDDLVVSLEFGDETIEVTAAFDEAASATAMDDDAMDDMDHSDMDDDAMDDMEESG